MVHCKFLRLFFFFNVDHFKSLFQICHNSFCSMFLVPSPRGTWEPRAPTGIKPTPPALEGEIPTIAPPGKSLHGSLWILKWMKILFWFCTCYLLCFISQLVQKPSRKENIIWGVDPNILQYQFTYLFPFIPYSLDPISLGLSPSSTMLLS